MREIGKGKKKEKGFTLIELMAVLVILGILGTIVVVNVAPVLVSKTVNQHVLPEDAVVDIVCRGINRK